MSNSATINLTLHRKQARAFESEATEILYGGAAGGGKSHLMRSAFITWCAAIPGLQCYLFRRIREDLVKNHMEGPKGFRMLLAPWAEAKLVTIVEDEIRFWNGSKIYLCHCKDEKDRFKYQGAEIHVLGIDELTHFTSTIYYFLRSRVRAVGLNLPQQYVGRFPRILAGSNPGGIGHQWVKADFIDDVEPMALRRMDDEQGGMLRQYIPARLDDNPSMTSDDPNYRSRLRGLGSPELVRAMEHGDWNVVAGAYFPEWNEEKHTRNAIELPKHWIRFRSFDYGSSRPFSVGWYAVSDGTLPIIKKGALIKYREWYGSQGPNIGLKLTIEQIANGIKSRELPDEKIDYSIADPAIFKEEGGPSIAETFKRNGVSFRPADNARIAGWNQIRSRLEGEDDEPMLIIFNNCRDTLRTLPSLQNDEVRIEDIDTDQEDHAADELRYACMSRPWVRVEVKPEAMKHLSNMTFNDLIKQTTVKKQRARL